jgi:hypothetical protein
MPCVIVLNVQHSFIDSSSHVLETTRNKLRQQNIKWTRQLHPLVRHRIDHHSINPRHRLVSTANCRRTTLERLRLLSTSGYRWIPGPLLQSTEMKIYAQPSRTTNSWEANNPSIVSLWDQPLFIQMESYKILVYCNRHLMTDTHPLGFYSKLP